ncbi:MAG: hypothetical protein ABL308_12640 [Oceanicaulis sp.]
MSPVHRIPPGASDAPGAVIAHVSAGAAGVASLGVFIAQSHILLPLAGMGCGFCLLFWLRRKLLWWERLFYALASFFAALPFVWPISDWALAAWPGTPPSARMAVGFLTMMTLLPLVILLRAGTKWIEDNPAAAWLWINNRLPERWRWKPKPKPPEPPGGGAGG